LERGKFNTEPLRDPYSSFSIPAAIGETVQRDGFVFTDVTSKATLPHRGSHAEEMILPIQSVPGSVSYLV
jgi:hypothetical protein